jgi:hypothetical protein
VSFQILKSLKSDEDQLAQRFDILFTNIDEFGNANSESQPILWQSQRDRTLYFNHTLHFLEILKKGTWKVPVDSSKAYDELRVFLDNEQAWNRPGQHVIVLRKKESY